MWNGIRWVVLAGGLMLVPLVVGCTSTPTGPTPTSRPQFVLVPEIRGCAETDQGQTVRGPGDWEEQSPKVEVIDGMIRYSRALKHLCCRKVEFKQTVEDTTITLTEIWAGEGCRCICFSELSATVEAVPSGTYTVRVVTQGIPDEPGDTGEHLVIETQVAVP